MEKQLDGEQRWIISYARKKERKKYGRKHGRHREREREREVTTSAAGVAEREKDTGGRRKAAERRALSPPSPSLLRSLITFSCHG